MEDLNHVLIRFIILILLLMLISRAFFIDTEKKTSPGIRPHHKNYPLNDRGVMYFVNKTIVLSSMLYVHWDNIAPRASHTHTHTRRASTHDTDYFTQPP